MNDKQIAFQTMRTLGCIGTYLFSRNHITTPKTKKGLSKLAIQNESLLWAAQILTGNDDLTMDDLIDIGVNGKDFRRYMKPYTNDVRYKEFMMKYKISDYDSVDFVTIENGKIHWHGYFYNACGWHSLEYSDFYTTLDDFINKYHKNAGEAYEAEVDNIKQYILAEDDGEEGEYDEAFFQKEFEGCMEGATHINVKDITTNTPDGYYVLKEKEE